MGNIRKLTDFYFTSCKKCTKKFVKSVDKLVLRCYNNNVKNKEREWLKMIKLIKWLVNNFDTTVYEVYEVEKNKKF